MNTMPATTTPTLVTAAEYFAMPEGPPYFQLIRGEIVMSPSPLMFHQRVLMRISGELYMFLDAHPIGEVVVSPSDVHLTNIDVYQPDVYYVSNKRQHIFNQQGAVGAPDLVVEILSKSTARHDLHEKKETYAECGVTEYWVVHVKEPLRVDVYRLQESVDTPARSVVEGQPLTTDLLPGLVLDTAKIFRR